MKDRRGLVTGAIVGLGNIGFGFNADRKRKGVWSHERAFARCGRVRLVAAAEPEAHQRDRFLKARPEIPVFPSLGALLRWRVPELVSLCTPPETHAPLLARCVRAGVKAVFCEKPLASTAAEALRSVRLCRERGVILAVNHTRRWDARYCRAAGLVRRGCIGRVLCVSAHYPGQIFNMGTHLVDAIRQLTGLDPRSATGESPDPKVCDPHVSGLLRLSSDVPCVLVCHGCREDLVFEIDIVGSQGRLRVLENGLTTQYQRFSPSGRYSGYRELRPAALPGLSRSDRFVAAVRDVCAALAGGPAPACSGEDGYYALAAAEALADSALRGGRPRRIAAPLGTR